MLKKLCFASLLLVSTYAGIGTFTLGVEGAPATADVPTDLVKDLEQLQGDWEMKASTQDGEKYVLHKSIAGNLETLSTYQDGKLVSQQTSNIELKEFGPAKVVQWTNCVRTYGPTKGKKVADGSFIYRLEDDQWVAVHGMLKGNWTDFYVEEFDRVESPAK